MTPKIFRRRLSCPECGLIVPEWDTDKIAGANAFKCTRCNHECSGNEFMEDNQEKWNREADLSGEGER